MTEWAAMTGGVRQGMPPGTRGRVAIEAILAGWPDDEGKAEA